MTTQHNHPPTCCCRIPSAPTGAAKIAQPCPACVEHGELATHDHTTAARGQTSQAPSLIAGRSTHRCAALTDTPLDEYTPHHMQRVHNEGPHHKCDPDCHWWSHAPEQ